MVIIRDTTAIPLTMVTGHMVIMVTTASAPLLTGGVAVMGGMATAIGIKA
jgi:hypothetical protein